MSQRVDAPCSPYTTSAAVHAAYPNVDPSLDLDPWVEIASELLYMGLGRQFPGLCTATIRPGHQNCSCGGSCGAHAFGWPLVGGYGGFWGWGAGWLAAEFSAVPQLLCAPEIDLGQNCRAVTSVKIDGTEIDPATWRLDPLGKLVRQPDPATGQPLIWPCCQSTAKPSGEVGTFEIVFQYGDDPPTSVVQACIVFAGQLGLGAAPATAGQCQLPERTQTLTRQGVTAALISDLTVLIDRGYTGIPFVDRVLGAFNPHHLDRRARVFSPDVPPHRLMGP
jgi:hypothetical protein